jgi:hypothetical protein
MDLLIRLKEWGRRRGRPVSDPDPADRLAGNAFAADLIQRDKDRPCSIWVYPGESIEGDTFLVSIGLTLIF